jgi:ATP-binding protein involved in chromosome partitioning
VSEADGYARLGRIVAVASGKGGVGKSTVAVNLALALAERGAAVGLVDADIHGPSVPGMLGLPADAKPAMNPAGRVEPARRHGIGVISMAMLTGDDAPAVMRGPMVTKYLRLFVADVDWGRLDWLILDLPPGTGDVQLTLAQSFPLAGAVIVTTPQDVSLKIARRGVRMFEQVKVPILGVVENMSGFHCPSCGTVTDVFRRGGGARLAEALGAPFLGAVPLDASVVDCGDEGAPVVLARPDGAPARAYRALAAALAGREAGAGGLPARFSFGWTEGAGVRAADAAPRPDGPPTRALAVERLDARTLGIAWADGFAQRIDVRDLRLACPCAACVEETSGRALLDPAAVPLDVAPTAVGSVGNYALALSFSDGHSTGIYSWDRLRGLGATEEEAL